MTSPWRTKRPTAASISRAQGRLEKTGGAVQHATGHGDELAIDLTEYQARLLNHKAEAGAWAWAALQVDSEEPATEAEACVVPRERSDRSCPGHP